MTRDIAPRPRQLRLQRAAALSDLAREVDSDEHAIGEAPGPFGKRHLHACTLLYKVLRITDAHMSGSLENLSLNPGGTDADGVRSS
jgi:hypothetical protein